MREIKFRAWDTIEKKMRDDALLIGNIGLGEGSVIASMEVQTDNPLIWMEFTGLKDKNGKEIYEGDIVAWKTREGKDEVGEIYCNEDGAEWHIRFSKDEDYGFRKSEALARFEVIGNIYENKELLKE